MSVRNLSFKAWRDLVAPDILGASPAIVHALEHVRHAAEGEGCVLLTGEPGTGKELFARAFHRGSDRAEGPLAVINWAAMPEALQEAELFGSQRSAPVGRLASADGGTLFFEEIADLTIVPQVKVLHAIDHRTVCPLGGNIEVIADVRVIAATHRDLEALVAEGSFRADLLQRIAAHRIALPALRDRGTDAWAIAEAMLRDTAAKHGVTELDASAREALLLHAWPGNLPELHKAIERGLRYATGFALTADDLDLDGTRHSLPADPLAAGSEPELRVAEEGDDPDLQAALAAAERRLINQALHLSSGDRKKAAARLGLRPTALIRKLRK